MKYDVAVIGAGIAGCMAAVSAARLGAKTLICDRYGFPGGTLTAGGTGPMMTFHAGDILAVRGITDELVQRMKKKGASPGHILDTTGYTYSVTPFSAEGMKTELEEMLLESGADILYHTIICDATLQNKEIKHLEAFSKNGKHKIEAKNYVDATGDCDISFLCGLPYSKGRSEDGKCQPVTMNFKMINVDIDAVKNYIKSNNSEFPRLNGDLEKVDRAPRLSIGGYVNTLSNAQKDGRISFLREDILFFETDRRGEVIVNTTRVTGIDPTDPSDLTRAEIAGRKQAAEVAALLKESVSGFENAVMEFSGPFIGVRSSRQIEGAYKLKAEDIISCRRFSDVIACGGYPIDVHSPDGEDKNVYNKKSLKWGDMYTIPYSSLISKSCTNLVTAGRCISAEFEAQAAIRVSPNAGATGHAAGAASAIAAAAGVDIDKIDIKKLQSVLKNQGAYLE